MSEPLTVKWLDDQLGRQVEIIAGSLQNYWWDCGYRFDNGTGCTRLRVLDSGGCFIAEIAQDLDGSDVRWQTGIGLPVTTREELLKLCEGLKIKSRLLETPA